MGTALHITQIDHPAGRVVRFQGPLDASNTPALDQLVTELIASPPSQEMVVLDCSEVDFMGSLAFGAIIRLKKQMLLKGCSVRLATVPAPIYASMKSARLHQFFDITDSVEAALGEVI